MSGRTRGPPAGWRPSVGKTTFAGHSAKSFEVPQGKTATEVASKVKATNAEESALPEQLVYGKDTAAPPVLAHHLDITRLGVSVGGSDGKSSGEAKVEAGVVQNAPAAEAVRDAPGREIAELLEERVELDDDDLGPSRRRARPTAHSRQSPANLEERTASSPSIPAKPAANSGNSLVFDLDSPTVDLVMELLRRNPAGKAISQFKLYGRASPSLHSMLARMKSRGAELSLADFGDSGCDLDLSNSENLPRSGDDVLKDLAEALAKDRSLSGLLLNACGFGSHHAVCSMLLSQQPRLRKLALASNHLLDDGIERVADALKSTCIEVLVLEDNGLTCRGLSPLLDATLKGSHLKELHLSQNRIGDDCIQLFEDALRARETPAQVLDLCSNPITADAAEVFKRILSELQKLQRLWIRDQCFAHHALPVEAPKTGGEPFVICLSMQGVEVGVCPSNLWGRNSNRR